MSFGSSSRIEVAGCMSVGAVKWMGVTGQQFFLRQCCSSRSQGLTQARS